MAEKIEWRSFTVAERKAIQEQKKLDRLKESISEEQFRKEYAGSFPIFEDMLTKYKTLYKAPFRYDKSGTTVWDAENNMVLNIRGWGRISSTIQDESLAGAIQDSFGHKVAELLTDWYEGKTEALQSENQRLQGIIEDINNTVK